MAFTIEEVKIGAASEFRTTINNNFAKLNALGEVESTKINLIGIDTDTTTNRAHYCYNNSLHYNTVTHQLTTNGGNDIAEYRKTDVKAGKCVVEIGDGSLMESNSRLMPGACVVSDTAGVIIGPSYEEGNKNDNSEVNEVRPIAIAGRVLVEVSRNKREYKVGQCVCSGINGTVDIMTREEIKEYPDCIVGIVSEIPEYEKWNGIDVRDRIWIRVK